VVPPSFRPRSPHYCGGGGDCAGGFAGGGAAGFGAGLAGGGAWRGGAWRGAAGGGAAGACSGGTSSGSFLRLLRSSQTTSRMITIRGMPMPAAMSTRLLPACSCQFALRVFGPSMVTVTLVDELDEAPPHPLKSYVLPASLPVEPMTTVASVLALYQPAPVGEPQLLLPPHVEVTVRRYWSAQLAVTFFALVMVTVAGFVGPDASTDQDVKTYWEPVVVPGTVVNARVSVACEFSLNQQSEFGAHAMLLCAVT